MKHPLITLGIPFRGGRIFNDLPGIGEISYIQLPCPLTALDQSKVIGKVTNLSTVKGADNLYVVSGDIEPIYTTPRNHQHALLIDLALKQIADGTAYLSPYGTISMSDGKEVEGSYQFSHWFLQPNTK